MSGWSQPDAGELDRLQRLVARSEVRAYVFDELDNPEWVPLLAERGFFDSPPSLQRDEEPGSVRLLPWPEGRYLIRMAPLKPDAVAAVLEEQRSSDNPVVTRTLLQGAHALPDDHLRRLAPKIVEWLRRRLEARFGDYLADEAADVISRLARIGAADAGIEAARFLFALERDPDPTVLDVDGESVELGTKPVSRLSEWDYEQAVAAILPDVVDAAGSAGLNLFSSLLHDALRFSHSRSDPDVEADYSYIWRPSIADHHQNTDDGVRSALVSAVRDAAVRYAQNSTDALEDCVQQLEKRTILHRRIALHVLATVSGSEQLAAERIADKSLFDEVCVRHEYAALLRSRFGTLPAKTRQTYLDWVLAGPDVDAFRRAVSARMNEPPSDDDERHYVALWQRDWLSHIADQLPRRAEKLYQQHVERFGEPEHPEFPSWTSSSTGPDSPVTKEEMTTWPQHRVLSYLRAWHPDESAGLFGASMEGLGRVFEEVIVSRAAEYSDSAREVASLDPTYVRKFLNGLETAVKQDVSISWDPVLRLMRSIVQRPFEDDDEVPYRDRDPGWRWVRRAAASLLNAGVAEGDTRIPFERRNEIWQILEPLTSDPNPSPAHELDNLNGMGPFTLAINTNRGVAIRAVMTYALWCRRNLERQNEDVTLGFGLMPEVQDVLDRHLRPEHDPSVAIRAAYGERISLLAFLDDQWLSAKVGEIFPSSPEHSRLRDAAWNAYICWSPPYDSLFEVLRDEYLAAISRVPSGSERDLSHTEQADQKLGEHLVTFYWRGTLPKSILDRWFEIADDDLAAHSMNFVGQALRNTSDDVSPVVAQRIRDLWDARIAVILDEPDEHAREASAFATTFASAKLDEDWSLATLEPTLSIGSLRQRGREVIEHLAHIAAHDPATATRLTLQVLKNAANEWDHIGWRKQIQSLLHATIDVSDAETTAHRTAIVDHYVARGRYEFRGLIRRRMD